jgi:predicted amidohydrolase YtcJ
MRNMMREALTTKRQLLMHITADSSFKIVLNVIKETGTAAQWRPLRLRIEHNDIGNPSEKAPKRLWNNDHAYAKV